MKTAGHVLKLGWNLRTLMESGYKPLVAEEHNDEAPRGTGGGRRRKRSTEQLHKHRQAYNHGNIGRRKGLMALWGL